MKSRQWRVHCARQRAQLQVCEDRNSRISCDRGVLFEGAPAECVLATISMIMKHAVTSKGLQSSSKEYMDGQDFSLVVKAVGTRRLNKLRHTIRRFVFLAL